MIKLPRPLPFPHLLFAAFLGFALSPFPSSLDRRYASPAAAAPVPSIPYGLIWLDVQPDSAEVSLDGEFLDTGVWLISVAPGNHEVRVRKTGFRGYAGRIAVPPGGSVHLDVRLGPGPEGDS